MDTDRETTSVQKHPGRIFCLRSGWCRTREVPRELLTREILNRDFVNRDFVNRDLKFLVNPKSIFQLKSCY